MDWLAEVASGGNDLANTALSWGLNTMSSKWASDESYEKNRRLQKHNFEFQREMFQKQLDADNTALQRRMADADAAGLNANLLFGAGSQGAGTPSAGGGSSASVNVESPKADMMTAIQVSMAKKRQEAELDALEKQTNADVELKNAQAIKAMKEAGYTQHQIDYYINNGVFPGATETRTNSYSGPLGFGGSTSSTRPIRNKNTAYNDGLSNWEKEQLSKMPKEKWQNLSKAQRMMFPRELRTLYNQHYK